MRSTNLLQLLVLALFLGCSRTTPAAGPAPAAQEHAAHAVADHQDEPGEQMRHNRHFLISTDSLAPRLDRPGTIVIHVGRSDTAYLAGHIPGARFLPLAAVAATVDSLPNEFPPLEQMRRAFEALQIGDSNRIVIYGDDPGLLAARAWIALDLLGQADRAALLDGGLGKWRAENRPVETGPTMHTMQFVPFTPRPQPDRVVSAEWVRARLRDSTVLLVDARPATQFASGHLPLARNIFWMNAFVARDNPVLRPMHELHHALWQPAGADQPYVRTVVVYCQSGMQASHGYLVARYIGYPDVRLYDGSLADWIRRPSDAFPVER